MGRKSSSKGQSPANATTSPGKSSGFNPVLAGIVVVALLGGGAYAIWGRSDNTASASAATDEPKRAEPTAETIAKARRNAAFGPHKQAVLPPIPFAGYEPPRGRAIATAAFEFAAEHPEVAEYVPCFCGCQNAGHTGNADCFVKSRAANGDVAEWEPHGVECTVCIDVATRSRQMAASGASVTAIRAAVEKEHAAYPNLMPTPRPPAAAPAAND